MHSNFNVSYGAPTKSAALSGEYKMRQKYQLITVACPWVTYPGLTKVSRRYAATLCPACVSAAKSQLEKENV